MFVPFTLTSGVACTLICTPARGAFAFGQLSIWEGTVSALKLHLHVDIFSSSLQIAMATQ